MHYYAVMPRVLVLLMMACLPVEAQKWVTVWTASVQGPYPNGNASVQPNLKFAFPDPQTGAHDQTFRLIVLPDLWGREARLRFSNVFGAKPLTIDGVHAGLHWSGGAVAPGTNKPVRFASKLSVTIPPGESVWSDAVAVQGTSGRKLAVSFHIAGESGPMTWHAKALQTSYITPPGAGMLGASENEAAFPFTTTSWYFLDAVDMRAPSNTQVIVALGDSITDGTASTLNGDDRWPNALSRRLHAANGDRFAIVNAGIGGNQVAGPAEYSAAKPFSGGPSALQRLDRDVLSLSGVSTVIWLEGINDFGRGTNSSVATVQAAMKEGVAKLKARGIRVIGATVVSALGATNASHGSAEEDAKRRELNDWIRNSGTFDGVVDFDKATLDAATGGLKPEFIPESTAGGPGDKLHPNRAGYLAMAMSIDLKLLLGR
jgi:lysophospholipase L1-like esterase